MKKKKRKEKKENKFLAGSCVSSQVTGFIIKVQPTQWPLHFAKHRAKMEINNAKQ